MIGGILLTRASARATSRTVKHSLVVLALGHALLVVACRAKRVPTGTAPVASSAVAPVTSSADAGPQSVPPTRPTADRSACQGRARAYCAREKTCATRAFLLGQADDAACILARTVSCIREGSASGTGMLPEFVEAWLLRSSSARATDGTGSTT
jgi:hypothetical protein